MSLSRKEFLKHGLFSLGELLITQERAPAKEERTLRPPGMQAGRESECGNCEMCVAACPEGIVRRLDGCNGPVIDLAFGSCRFCYFCIGACPREVLVFPGEGKRPRLGIARTGAGCLAGGGCFTCSERCPEGALELVWGTGISIDPDRCVGCGTCESCCPVQPKAIRVEPLE